MSAHAPGVLPLLHVVTDDRVLDREDWVARAAAVVEAGADALMLHIRGPQTPGRRLLSLVRSVAKEARAAGAALAVNDRLDVALAAGVQGVHLGGGSLTPSDARAVVGSDARIGLSCHVPADLNWAGGVRVDYAFVGNVFRTASHPEREAKGTAWLRHMVTAAGGVPVIAIGGVTPGRVPSLLAEGAAGVAVLGGVWESPDPAAAVAHYIATLKSALQEANGGD